MGDRRRRIGKRLAAVLLSLALQAACCGNEDDVRVVSPDGKHTAHWYLRNCGATTDYVTMVTITVVSAGRDSVVAPRLSSGQGGRGAPARGDAHHECPSFADLGKQVDAKVEAITALEPGLPLEDFTAKFASPALNFWDNVGTDRETVFFVTSGDGNAQVSDELVCRFDQRERLRSCKRECCRSATRTIEETQYNSLEIGTTRRDVERRLCSPSASEADNKNSKRLFTYYHIDLPIGHHDEGQTVMLVFDDGKLSSKGMSPYY
jgi:hypothetical protein